MSAWDLYIDTTVNYCKNSCDQAVIIGLDGVIWTPWCDECGNAKTDAKSNILRITPVEAKRIADVIRTGNDGEFSTKGIVAGSVKYQFLRSDEGTTYYAKKKDHGCLTLQKTKSAVVIAHTCEGSQVGDVNQGVAKICDYLEGNGY